MKQLVRAIKTISLTLEPKEMLIGTQFQQMEAVSNWALIWNSRQ